MFSFNNPFRRLPHLHVPGQPAEGGPDLIVPDKSLSILDGAIQASGWNNIRGDGISRMYFDALSKKYHFSLTEPWETLPAEVKAIILYGTGGEKLELHYDQPRGKGVLYQPFEGICNNVERRYQETQSDAIKRELEELMAECPCPGLPGQAAEKGVPGCHRGGSGHRRHDPDVRGGRAEVGGPVDIDGSAAPDRRPHLKEIPVPAGLPPVRGIGVSDPLPQRRDPSPAARASGSGWPPRSEAA